MYVQVPSAVRAFDISAEVIPTQARGCTSHLTNAEPGLGHRQSLFVRFIYQLGLSDVSVLRWDYRWIPNADQLHASSSWEARRTIWTRSGWKTCVRRSLHYHRPLIAVIRLDDHVPFSNLGLTLFPPIIIGATIVIGPVVTHKISLHYDGEITLLQLFSWSYISSWKPWCLSRYWGSSASTHACNYRFSLHGSLKSGVILSHRTSKL